MFAQSSWYLANLENIEVIKLISQVGPQLHLYVSQVFYDIVLDFKCCSEIPLQFHKLDFKQRPGKFEALLVE